MNVSKVNKLRFTFLDISKVLPQVQENKYAHLIITQKCRPN